jgi:hypothetical protein
MPTLLDTIGEQLKNFNLDDLIEPETEVNSKDHVVGEMNADLKRLFGLARQWGEAANEVLGKTGYLFHQEHIEHHIEKALELREKSGLLTEIFWASVKESFGLWQKPSIGLRKGWKVVWSEPETPSSEVGIPLIISIVGGFPRKR